MIFNRSDIDKKISETHDSLKKQLEGFQITLNESVNAVGARINALESMFDRFQAQKTEEFQHIAQHLNSIQQTRENVEKSTRSFADVQRKIEHVVDEQLRTAIASSIQQLQLDAGKYDGAKKEIERCIGLLALMNGEILRFHAISKEIKYGDFQLLNYAKKLQHNDDERVRLLKQVDDLQRLIAKMRRSQSQYIQAPR